MGPGRHGMRRSNLGIRVSLVNTGGCPDMGDVSSRAPRKEARSPPPILLWPFAAPDKV